MNAQEPREIRQGLKLRQTEVAEYLGVDNETICRWEARNRELNKLRGEAIEKLALDPDQVNAIRGSRRRRRIQNRVSRFDQKAQIDS
jgi:DNA-binding transcriptional regulator YiaG